MKSKDFIAESAIPVFTGARRSITVEPIEMGNYPWTSFHITLHSYRYEFGENPDNPSDTYLLSIFEGAGGIVGFNKVFEKSNQSKIPLVALANKWLQRRIKKDPKLSKVLRWVAKAE